MNMLTIKGFQLMIGMIIFLGLYGCQQGNTKQNVDPLDDSIHDAAVLRETTDSAVLLGSYPLITPSTQIPGTIADTLAQSLPEHIKALAAFYSAMGGTDCQGE